MTITNNPNRLSSNEPSKEIKSTQSKNLQEGLDARPADSSSITNANSPVRAVKHLIYGEDDRKDIYEVEKSTTLSSREKEAILNDADSVVLLLSEDEIICQGELCVLKTVTFTDSVKADRDYLKPLCNVEPFVEPFFDQPTCGFCSGFLVAPDIVATAGHCLYEKDQQGIERLGDIREIRFAFDFRMKDSTPPENFVVSKSKIYKAVKLIAHQYNQYDGEAPDWALIKLDRPVSNYRIASVRYEGKIPDSQQIHVIGHPKHLPLKYADNAKVQRNEESKQFFVYNLDTFSGNSGSPVFNSQTHVVEAIHVARPRIPEFQDKGECVVSTRLRNDQGGGIGTRTAVFIEALRNSIWSEFKPVAGLCGTENQGADVAVADLNGNGKPDLIAFHIQNPDGENKGFYQIGRDLDECGNVTGWSEFIQVPGRFGLDTEEAGIAVTDLSNNKRPDLVIFHIEKNAAGNRGFYRIGYDLDAKGNVTRGWTQPIEIKARFGTSSQGAGIAITDLNGNGKPDLIVFFVDNPKAENPKSENKGYYFIGRDLDATGKVTGGWSEFLGVPGLFGAETQGAGVTVANINKRRCLIVFHLDHPTQGEKGNQGYYRIGWDLDAKGNVSGWSDAKSLPWRFGHESQGAGIATICFNGNTNPCFNGNTHPHMIVYHIDNPAGANKGYYRTGWILP